MNQPKIDAYTKELERKCVKCHRRYKIGDYLPHQAQYFGPSWSYREGCEEYCIDCWLDVGPEPDADGAVAEEFESSSEALFESDHLSVATREADWPYAEVYESLVDGDVLTAFDWYFQRGIHLSLMPIARINVERVIVYPGPIVFYPPERVDLTQLNLIPNSEETTSQAEMCSWASGIDEEVLDSHPLVVFPCQFDWGSFRRSRHEGHADFIRWMSGEIDRKCLNYVRYRLCNLGLVDTLPGRAGQNESIPTMAGAMVYNGSLREARIVGGMVFTHYVTRGLGLALEQLEWDDFPDEGEMGHIVEHALTLYSSLLESDSETSRFVQAMFLLEFLALPGDDYQKFKKVKEIISRYVAKDRMHFERLLERFAELTGKKDDTGRNIGYRTRMVHMGEQLEHIIPDHKGRRELFSELDRYIRPVIEHMIEHSTSGFDDYCKVREKLRPDRIEPTEEEIPF